MKTRRRTGSVALLGVAAVMIVCSAGVASAQESGQTTTRASMRGLFVTISNLYKYSLSDVAFEDPKNHAEIRSMLEALAQNADALEAHGGGLDPSFDFMRRSLARDAHDALESHKSGNYMNSRYVLSEITQNCVTCHTKVPMERSFESGKEFLAAIDTENMPTGALARLQVASRQFPDAMKTYETLMTSRDVSADDLGVYDAFENYIRISVGAMNDTKRPVATLEKFVKRTDMPEAVKAEARVWIKSLETIKLDAPKGEELVAARKMVAGAREKTKSRSDRSGLVDYVGSITLAHRYLRAGAHDDASVAEAYYLIGVAESYVSHSYWISETNYLLERAIRMAPKTETARDALAFLESYRRSAQSIPARAVPEGQTSIEELKKLTEQ